MTTTETNPLPRASECDVCGNMYDKAFTVTRGDEVKVFDSFECAIESMAPRCGHCACRVLGHGVESDGQVFCCAHCARQVGEHGLVDRDG